MEEPHLSEKQKAFVREYIVDFNATQAAVRAKYSKKTAGAIGAENLKKPQIQQAITKAIENRALRTERTADEVVLLMWRMAELDMADYVTVSEGGEVQAIPFDQLPPGATKLISKIKERRTIRETADGTQTIIADNLEYEVPDRHKCVEMLGRHYGLFRDKVEFPDKDGNPQPIGAVFGDTERAARLLYLLEQAELRAKQARKGGKK